MFSSNILYCFDMLKSNKYLQEEANLIIVSGQKFRDHISMLSKKILQRVSRETYEEVAHRTLQSVR